MTPEIRDFIQRYSSAEEKRIKFDWNAKHGSEFADRNLQFRSQVFKSVLEQPDGVPPVLWRDLFRAETEFAREAWCVSGRIGELALHLVKASDGAYVVDYFRGLHQSFDTSMGASLYNADLSVLRSMLLVVEGKLIDPSVNDRELLEAGLKKLREWIAARGAQ
jgi:hypothetical protein